MTSTLDTGLAAYLGATHDPLLVVTDVTAARPAVMALSKINS